MYLKRRNNVTELFGLPGSGKTTFINNNKINDEVQSDTWFCLVRLYNSTVLLGLVLLCTLRGNFKLFRYKTSLVKKYIFKSTFACGDGVYLDEGVLQRVLSIFETKLSRRKVYVLCRILVLPSRVTIFMRKDGKYFERYTQNHIRNVCGRVDWKENMEHNFLMLRSYLLDKKNITIREITW